MQSVKPFLTDERIEWILVDGGSICSTSDERRLLEYAFSKASSFVHEADNGIYDAMNKGTGMSHGEYVLYLNAGDLLHEEFNLDILFQEVNDSSPAMIWGSCIERYLDGQEIEIKARAPSLSWYGIPAYHPAIFFKRALLGNSPYDTSFKIAADYDLICKLVRSGGEIHRTALRIAIFFRGGLSDTSKSLLRKEEHTIRMQRYNLSRSFSMIIMTVKTGLSNVSNVIWLRRLLRRLW
jgi:putative colanic acid biosynthesis glycosyltransferase